MRGNVAETMEKSACARTPSSEYHRRNWERRLGDRRKGNGERTWSKLTVGPNLEGRFEAVDA